LGEPLFEEPQEAIAPSPLDLSGEGLIGEAPSLPLGVVFYPGAAAHEDEPHHSAWVRQGDMERQPGAHRVAAPGRRWAWQVRYQQVGGGPWVGPQLGPLPVTRGIREDHGELCAEALGEALDDRVPGAAGLGEAVKEDDGHGPGGARRRGTGAVVAQSGDSHRPGGARRRGWEPEVPEGTFHRAVLSAPRRGWEPEVPEGISGWAVLCHSMILAPGGPVPKAGPAAEDAGAGPAAEDAGAGPAAEDVQAAYASALVDEWARAGLRHVVLSPGSRSTPLLLAASSAADEGLLVLHVVLDERSAGFFALGAARGSGEPAVVLTTSGTAAAELHAAVIEADRSGVPLIVVTADRPPELQDCGAPQTIHQQGIFGRSVRWDASPGVADLAGARAWRSIASRAFAEARGATGKKPGPVHLNVAFREPLLGSADKVAATDAPRLEARAGRMPWHRVDEPGELPPPERVVQLLAAAGERGLIVAGQGCADPGDIWELARTAGWAVIADPTSGCRFPGSVGAADSLLRTDRVRRWRPDVVLRLGAPPASRVVGEWLSELDCLQILADRWGDWAAPDRSPHEVVVASPSALCRAVSKALPAACGGTWAAQWAAAEMAAQAAIGEVLAAEAELTEPGIARAVSAAMPQGSTLLVSSSMPVRDLEWWSEPREGLRVVANRGANGIDGVLSTALGLGAAVAGPVASQPRSRAGDLGSSGGAEVGRSWGEAGGSGGAESWRSGGAEAVRKVVALVGDLAFLHDAGSLLWAPRRHLLLDVVVVDNNGGGIFNFLPQASAVEPRRFELFWGTPHGLDLCAIAKSYGVEAKRLASLEELTAALGERPTEEAVRVLVAPVRREANVQVHKRLHLAVAQAVEEAFS
jgi:2-succinyl-5-enolpyruvyl-6-hydroxy-3-cyclohexene-1-carboxylate synthase